MPNLTISLPPELYERMKKHPEIRWSVVIRRFLEEYIRRLEGEEEEKISELARRLNIEGVIDEIPDESAVDFAKEMVDKRAKKALRY